MDLKDYKYQLKATSIGMGGLVYKKNEKTIFDPKDKKFLKLSDEIISAFRDNHLEMVPASKKKYEADLKAEKSIKEKASKEVDK